MLTIPETDASVRACEQEVVRLVNAERAKHGLAALTEDWELSRVARYKSQDMHDNRYFAHNRSDLRHALPDAPRLRPQLSHGG